MYLARRTPEGPREIPVAGAGRPAARIARQLCHAGFPGLLCLALFSAPRLHAAQVCRQMTLQGEVSAAREWKGPIGEGWVIRLVPIPPLQAGYTGWDLVVDRERPAGFPDALYLATPPYNSINQREIGTTYGLRAQDAIGWNPRSFRFLTDPAAFREAKQDYDLAFELHKDPVPKSGIAAASAQLLRLTAQAPTGQLTILDARLVPGTADPAAFAQQWSRAASRSRYQVEAAPPGKSTARGELRWMRFRITLWLPQGWLMPRGVHGVQGSCGE
jgi:hypothetical protein